MSHTLMIYSYQKVAFLALLLIIVISVLVVAPKIET
jgi:hypothetical protein